MGAVAGYRYRAQRCLNIEHGWRPCGIAKKYSKRARQRFAVCSALLVTTRSFVPTAGVAAEK